MSDQAPDVLKFTADKRELVAALTWACVGISTRPPVPVLAGMRLDMEPGRLTVAGFDYEMTARAAVAVEGITRGSVLVIGRALLKAVKGLPGGKGAQVLAEVNGDAITVRSGGVSASSPVLAGDLAADYPQLPEMPPAAGVMAGAELRRTVGRVVPAASRDDTLPMLTCVHVEFGKGAATFSATDRYRLAIGEVTWTATASGKLPAVNVWAGNLAAFAKVADPDGKVTVHVGERPEGSGTDGPMIGMSDGTREMITRTNGSEYPRMGDRFPAETGASADVDAAAFTAAVKRAAAQSARGQAVRLHVTRDGITVTARGEDDQETSRETVPLTDELDAPTAGGRRITGWRCAYNPVYLAELTAGVDGTVRLAWAPDGLGKPLVIRPADTSDRYRALVMPIRLH